VVEDARHERSLGSSAAEGAGDHDGVDSTGDVRDLEAIRDVAMRYARGVDRLDAECMRSAYWPDAVDDHGVFSGNAWEFVDHCMVTHRRWSSTMHCIFNHRIELAPGGRSATGEIYNVTYLVRADEPVLETWWGRYLDRYQQRNGEWRIIHRMCVHESTTAAPITPMQINAAAFRQGSHDRGGQASTSSR